MTSPNLIDIKPEAYNSAGSDGPSRSMWRLTDTIPILYQLYTRNFYTDRLCVVKLNISLKLTNRFS